MKLSSSRWGSWLPVLVLLAVIGLLSSFVVSFFRKEADEVATSTVPKMVAISLANKSLSEAFIGTLRAVMADDEASRQAFATKVAERSAQTSARLEEYGKLANSEQEERQLKDLLAARQRYFETRDSVFSALQSGNQALADQISQKELQNDFATYEQLGFEMLEAHASGLRANTESVAKSASILQIMTGSISSALFLFAFCLGLFVGLILVPAASVRSVLERDAVGGSAAPVAAGELADKTSG
jgi:hypothetical protein